MTFLCWIRELFSRSRVVSRLFYIVWATSGHAWLGPRRGLFLWRCSLATGARWQRKARHPDSHVLNTEYLYRSSTEVWQKDIFSNNCSRKRTPYLHDYIKDQSVIYSLRPRLNITIVCRFTDYTCSYDFVEVLLVASYKPRFACLFYLLKFI